MQRKTTVLRRGGSLSWKHALRNALRYPLGTSVLAVTGMLLTNRGWASGFGGAEKQIPLRKTKGFATSPFQIGKHALRKESLPLELSGNYEGGGS